MALCLGVSGWDGLRSRVLPVLLTSKLNIAFPHVDSVLDLFTLLIKDGVRTDLSGSFYSL